MKRRLFTLVATGLILLLAFAGPAQAVVEKLHIKNGATLYYGGIRVFGHVQCTDGQTASFTITARQGTGFGKSTGSFPCSGDVIAGSFTVNPDTGYFTCDPARVRASIDVTDGDQRTVKKTVNVGGNYCAS
jgi:hypothetical protein